MKVDRGQMLERIIIEAERLLEIFETPNVLPSS